MNGNEMEDVIATLIKAKSLTGQRSACLRFNENHNG